MGQSTNGTNDAAAPPKMDRRRSSIAVPRHLEVLVADDDLDTRSALAKAVAELGHTVRVARDGAEAHRMLQERHADVVISDWEMPGMNGAELCRATRVADEEAPYTYFILMTGHADREHLLAGMNAGADDYQRKPIDLDELEARLVSAARVVALHRRLADRTAALRRDSRRFYVASRTDALTTAGNRLALHEEIEALRSRADRYGHRYCLAICDIDFFKQFNDKFGHLAGDEALRRVADAIRANVRASDGLFRYGGEEFVVLFPEQSLGEASRAMERVRDAVERLAIPAASEGKVLTISAGVAELDPATDRRAEDWLSRADAALYGAKADGRNRVEVMHSASDDV